MRGGTALFVFGTRPEAIKLAPVIRAFAEDERWRARVIVTGQHREMLDQVMSLFKLKPDVDLQLMTPGQTLAGLSAGILSTLDPLLAADLPQVTLVQGDTTSALCGAMASFYRGVPVAHVEAGLRTWNRRSPFPEEVNRQLIARIADLHFAPTKGAAENLLDEGVSPDDCIVTGNTAIDALHLGLQLSDTAGWNDERLPYEVPDGRRKIILVTGHRRENHGQGIDELCVALKTIAARHPDCEVVYPIHRNPLVSGPVRAALEGTPRIRLTDPLPYVEFIRLLRAAYLVITDSGGIQEEAPSLGVPLLVTRDTTERPEGIAEGTAILTGSSTKRICEEADRLLSDPVAYARMQRAHNPYGDGKSSGRILEACSRFLS